MCCMLYDTHPSTRLPASPPKEGQDLSAGGWSLAGLSKMSGGLAVGGVAYSVERLEGVL